MDLISVLKATLYVIIAAFLLVVFIGFPWALYDDWKARQRKEASEYEREHIGYREDQIG